MKLVLSFRFVKNTSSFVAKCQLWQIVIKNNVVNTIVFPSFCINFAPKIYTKERLSKDNMTKSKQNGLYQRQYEHDACGVGMVVNIHGGKSHELVDQALRVLENMEHRGAETRDKTGDGAGIMLQIPHEFILLQGIPVPEKGKYGT